MMSDINTVQFFNKNIQNETMNSPWRTILHVPLFYKGFTTGTFYLQNLQWGGVILQNNFIRTNVLMIMAI